MSRVVLLVRTWLVFVLKLFLNCGKLLIRNQPSLRRWACNPTFTDDSLRQQWSTLSTIPHPIWNEEPAKRNSGNRLHISWSIVYMNSPVTLENNTHQQEQPGQTCLLVTPQRRQLFLKWVFD
jgi:hypothetical protein